MAQKKKGKKTRHKASAVKLSNKRITRLIKQGKLKPRKNSEKKKLLDIIKKRVQPQQTEDEIQPEPEDIPLEEADYEYFATPDRNLSFLTDKAFLGDKPKRKRKQNNYDLEEDYEQLPRKRLGDEKQFKALLPIKSKEKGLITRVEEVTNEEAIEEKRDDEVQPESSSNDVQSSEETVQKSLPPLSTGEILIQRQIHLLEKKQKMALLASDVIEQPQEAVAKLKQLRGFLEEMDPDLFLTVRKLAMVTLLEVFKDIIPGYRIRVASDEEKNQLAKKETVQLRRFEESLLSNYRKYLKYLDFAAKGKIEGKVLTKMKTEQSKAGVIPQKAKEALRILALRCLCELLITHPHFNYRTNIITVVIPFVVHRSQKLSDLVGDYIKRLFREDKSGEVTLEVVRQIGRIIKARHFDVKTKVLQLFLSLKVKEVNKGDEQVESKAARRERIKRMSRRERKRYKQMKELERELGEASSEEKRKRKLRLHTEIISLVFLTYFRILKKARHSVLLSAVLEGLARFAHLINVDFFDDLFAVLNDLVNSGELTYRESLHCVQTAFTILSGQGAALNIDPMNFYRHLYKSLFQLHAGVSSEDVLIALKCMDVMINKRRKQVSQARVLAYLKRLVTLCLQLETHGIIGVLATARGFMHAFPKTELLLDTEYQGSGTFLPDLDEPEHCNAHNTALYELHLLQRHYHPVVRQYAAHLLAGAPSQGNSSLPAELAHKPAVDLYAEFEPGRVMFKPTIPKLPKHNRKRAKFGRSTDFLQDEMKTMISKVEVDIEKIDVASEISKMYENR